MSGPGVEAMHCVVCAGESFAETDKRYLAAEAGANRDDGCTAVTAVLTEHSVVVAHVGDSRAVLSRAGKGAPARARCLPSGYNVL